MILTLWLLAHSWYPTECCSDGHCAPVPGKQVTISADGYEVHYRDPTVTYYAPKWMVKPSPDGKYHLCVVGGKPVCFFAPQAGA